MKDIVLCKLLAFIRYFAEACLFPFISLYLKEKGLDIDHIGIIMAILPITSIACAPLYAKFCTNPQKTRIALFIMSSVEAIFVIAFLFVSSFWAAACIILGISIVSSSNYGMIDSLLTLIAEEHQKKYSSIRIYGSTAYMIGVLASGLLTQYISYRASFLVTAILFFVVSLFYFLLKVPIMSTVSNTRPKLKTILANKLFLFYLIFYVLFIGTMQIGDDFFSLYMESKQGGSYYSYVMFAFIVVEIITLFILNRFGKKIGMKLYFVTIVLLILRNAMHAIPHTPLWFIISWQMVRGVIWASALYLSSTFVSKLLGYQEASSGIILVLLGVQIFNAIFKFSGGYIIKWIGYSNFYGILLGFSILALISYIFYYPRIKNIEL